MSIFRKNKIHFEEENEKTPVKFSKREDKLDPSRIKKKRKIKRIVITTITVIIISFLGFFGFKGYNSIKNIFEGETGILNLLNGSPKKPLKGESEGRVNFLLLGVGDEGHDGATLSDTIIIVSLDTNKKAVAMFSVPRDLYVKIPKYGYGKINSAHAYGEQYKYPGGGPALAKKTVEETFGIPIHYYGRVDFSGLSKLVDAVGGVSVDVERSFCDYNYPVERKGDTSKICFDQGKQQMNGVKALQYARSRHAAGPEGSDFARSKRQQKIILAIKEKALSANTVFNPKKVLDITSVLGNHLKTDLEMWEIARLYEFTKELNNNKIISKNFDNSPEGMLVSSSSSAGYILQPKGGDFKEIQAVIKSVFTDMGLRDENAVVGVYNGTYNTTIFDTLVKNMKSSGYNVTKSGPAETKNYAKTVIIDYTDGKKPETIKALEAKFKVTATKESSSDSNLEIKIIVGKDFKG